MNDLVTTAMWDNAVRDRDAEEAREALVRSKVAVAGLWPFLAAAATKDEFGHRLALQLDTITSRVSTEQLDSVVSSLAEDWDTLHEARLDEARLQVEAASKVASDQDPMVYPAVAMYTTAAGDDHHYQVDHIASPSWLKTIHRGADQDQARQAAREFALSQGMPLYVDGHRVEGRVHVGQEFFHVASGTWMPVRQPISVAAAMVAPDEVRDQFKGLHEICAGTGMRAHGATHDCPHCGQTVPTTGGKGGKTFAMTHWAPGAGIFDKQSAFTPDPSDAQRYNRYPVTPSPQTGGSVAGPPSSTIGPDGFPIDLGEGEQRSQEAYQRQLTPGAWTVPPGGEWRDSTRPNAATGMPQGQYPGANNAAQASLRTAGEGVVPTPGPNPNYFSQGTQGLAGPNSFPEGPGPEPKTDNRVDDVYGAVPPVPSSGSTQGQTDGQGYSRQGVEASFQALANQYVQKQGDKWVVLQKGTGKVLSHHDSQEDAEASFRGMMWNKHKGSQEPRPFAEAGAPHIAAFNDSHVTDYVNWAKREGHDPDHPKTLKRYEALPGIGRAHTNHIADQLYIGGGDENWRQHTSVHHTAPGGGEHAPYRIEKVDGGYAVFNDKGERKNEEPKSHEQARQFQKALYKNVPGASESAKEDEAKKTAATDGRIVGHCDNCHAPVRWHQGDGEHELRHLHNGSNQCDHGGMSAKTSGVVVTGWGEREQALLLAGMAAFDRQANAQFGYGANDSPMATPDPNVPQADDPNDPSQMSNVTGMRRQADALESPTSDNPTGRGEDEFRAKNWDAYTRQRPMQSAEERNVNTPVLPQEPIRTLDTNGPRERGDQDEDETENEPAGREASLRQEARMGIPIVCMSCGTRGTVAQVTASLACRCGSHDLDVDDFETTASQHVAYPQGPHTGWGKSMPDPAANWSDYQGPLPGPNPQASPPVNDTMICPACHGAGYDVMDKTLCRMCNGRGVVKPTTSTPTVESYDVTTGGPPIGGARWQGHTTSARVVAPIQIHGGGGGGGNTYSTSGSSATLTYVSGRPPKGDPTLTAEYQNRHGAPGYGAYAERSMPFSPGDVHTFYPKADTMAPTTRHRQEKDYSVPTGKHYPMNEASCPNCGHKPTELRKDVNSEAWWYCPGCKSPLANIDAHPEINPYDTEANKGMKPDHSMKTSKLRRGKSTGKLIKMLATIHSANQGIDPAEAVGLARNTIAAYREN
jgi:hypothetical protein